MVLCEHVVGTCHKSASVHALPPCSTLRTCSSCVETTAATLGPHASSRSLQVVNLLEIQHLNTCMLCLTLIAQDSSDLLMVVIVQDACLPAI